MQDACCQLVQMGQHGHADLRYVGLGPHRTMPLQLRVYTFNSD